MLMVGRLQEAVQHGKSSRNEKMMEQGAELWRCGATDAGCAHRRMASSGKKQ
jgi:hypothetical protein